MRWIGRFALTASVAVALQLQAETNLERGKRVKTAVISNRTKTIMQPLIRENVEAGSEIHSDEWANYYRMDGEYIHNVINHLEKYVDGNITRTGWRTSGACSSEPLAELT